MPDLIAAIAAYIPRDRVATLLDPHAPQSADGVALIADLSGFTQLTEALASGLSADQGAEELTRALDRIFTPLVRAIHSYGGSVLKFGGDALIVWYPRPPRVSRRSAVRQAITSALVMQAAMQTHGTASTPIGQVTLRMKIGLAYGPLRRFTLGLPEYGYEDAPVGRTLDRMAEAEHHAEPGEVVTDQETLALAGDGALLAARRDAFAVIGGLEPRSRPRPWPELRWPPEAAESLRQQLTPYIPAPIARTLATGATQVAELKPVVSMFVQFHGLDYDGDALVGERLQAYFSAAQRAAERYGGRVNRLITGDKGSLLHLIFGAPIAVEEPEARAVRCALDLQRECGALPFITAQRIGIAGGRVFAGPVGGPERHDYTTMGDAINLSARLMQAAADGQVLVEAGVAGRLDPTFAIADLGSIRVKGKSEPVPICAIHSYQPVHRHAIREAPAIFGRDQELGLLSTRLEQISRGGGAILLVGEVGVGKTLLLDALQARAGKFEHPPQWLSSICLAYGQTLSGYVFIDLLREILGLLPGTSAGETRARLRVLCEDLFGAARVESSYPYLARFLGLATDESSQRLDGLSGESMRWRIFEVLRELFGTLARRRPLILALDDLQWADPTSLDLIEHLLPLTQQQTLTFILAMRPEQQSPAWALHQRTLTALSRQAFSLQLGALSAESARQFVAEMAPQIPEPVAAQLAEKSGGNPLFLVELVRALLARGMPASGSLSTIEVTDLPDSIQALLLAQIDRLTTQSRHILQIASVIGPLFLRQVLAIIAESDQAVDIQLADLTQHELIRPEDQRGEEYRFRHALIHQGAYSTLLYERRRLYHRQIAELLARLFPSQAIEQAGTLAYHYERADEYELALAHHLQAADSARLLGADEEAEALYQHALELLDRTPSAGDPEQRARIFLKLAQVRSNTLDFTSAQEYYNQAFALLEQVERIPAADTEAGERSIRLGVFEHGPSTLDPGQINATDITEIVRELFEGLVELDPELNIIPALARRWEVDQAGTRYRFELRANLLWSDGKRLTAEDFVMAWRRNLSPEQSAPQAHQLFMVAGAEAYHRGELSDPAAIGVRAISDMVLEVLLDAPAKHLLYVLATPVAFPQPTHIVRLHAQRWSEPANLVCNGPFVISEWVDKQRIRLRRSKTYHGNVPGNLQQAEFVFVQPTLERYLSGEVDLCIIEDRNDIQDDLAARVFLTQHLATYFLCYDCRHAPFDQVATRQALAHCVDRSGLVREVWSNVQRPADGGIVPPGVGAYSPEIAPIYDPARARQLLSISAAPTSTGQQPFTLATSAGFGGTPEYLQRVWREQLNVDIRVISDIPIEQILEDLAGGSVQLALIGWDLEYPDAGNILNALFHSDRSLGYFGWGNARFDQLVEQASLTANREEQLALYREADHLLVAEETAVLPLYYQQSCSILRPGYRIANIGTILRTVGVPLKYLQVDSAAHPEERGPTGRSG